jgi:hypothetical protein
MRIGIFGDSFADSKNGGTQFNQQGSWPQLLANTKKIKVENHALVGSGLEYSLIKLFEAGSRYDKLILTVTSPERLYINPDNHHKLLDDNEVYHHIRPTDIRKRKKDIFFNKANDVALEHYNIFNNNDTNNIRTALYIKALRDCFGGKILLLTCTNQSTKYNKGLNAWPHNELSLIDMFYHENKTLFPDGKIDWKNDQRSCHLTHWHHRMLYGKILKWIETDKFKLTKKDLLSLDKDEVIQGYFGKW